MSEEMDRCVRVRLAWWGLVLAAIAAASLGWRLFWFLTDDAFIAFRYVDQSLRGHGLSWNPPPFKHVEGYTSFLWVILLRLIWQITGIEPPVSANWVSLLFGIATLGIMFLFIRRMKLPEPLGRLRLLWAALAAVWTLGNRTFLAWLSSGLETALFNFCFIWWVYAATTSPERRGPLWTTSLALSVSLLTLSRPDGLLYSCATLVLLAAEVLGGHRGSLAGNRALGLLALLPVPAHLLWRRSVYGEWVPNTYFAKFVSPWPESGLRYLLSFAIEYGLAVWAALALLWVVGLAGRRTGRQGGLATLPWHLLIPASALAAHVGYYTLRVGGDHFEYRVFSHLIPLLFLSALWLASRLAARPAVVAAALILLILCSWPIPWVHWSETRGLTTRRETYFLARPIAHRFPAPLSPLVAAFDGLQQWLISHHVGMRHQEHKVYYETQRRAWPARSAGESIGRDQRVILAWGNVGVPGWVLPNVAIIDILGLNDRVIARNPGLRFEERNMAHDRTPPPGYVECFEPNLIVDEKGLRLLSRIAPLPDDRIRACEVRDWVPAAPAGSGRP